MDSYVTDDTHVVTFSDPLYTLCCPSTPRYKKMVEGVDALEDAQNVLLAQNKDSSETPVETEEQEEENPEAENHCPRIRMFETSSDHSAQYEVRYPARERRYDEEYRSAPQCVLRKSMECLKWE